MHHKQPVFQWVSYHSQLYNESLFGLVWCAKDYCGQMWYALHLGGLASSQLGHTGVSYVKQPGRWMLGRAQLFFPNFFWAVEASKLGGVGADWGSVHESFLFSAHSDNLSDYSEIIFITTLGLRQKDK